MAEGSRRTLLIGCAAIGVVLTGAGTVLVAGVGAWLAGAIPGVASPLDAPLGGDILPVYPDGPPPVASAPPAAAPVTPAPAPVMPTPTPTPAPPVAPPVPALVEARIVTTPPGARVLEGGVELGRTPLTLSVAGGASRTLHLEADGREAVDLAVQGDAARTYEITLPPAPAVAARETATETAAPRETPRETTTPTAPRETTSTTPRSSGGTARPGRPPRTGTLSHDDF